jgi:hypothetical protein
MAFQQLASLCEFTAVSTGTGNFVVSAATAGKNTPEQANVTDGKIYIYYAQSPDGTQFESGSGAYAISTHTLARTTITGNSNGDTNPVNFTVVPIVDVFGSSSPVLELGTSSWTAYTPTVTAGSGSFTAVSATGIYNQLGKTVFFQVAITITTNGTAATSVNATLPFTSVTGPIYVVAGRANAVSFKMLQGKIGSASTTVAIFNYDNTYPGASGETLIVSGVYQKA